MNIPPVKLTTLGIDIQGPSPHGVPILKALAGKYEPQLNAAMQQQFVLVEDASAADAFLLPANTVFYSSKQLREIGRKVKASGLPSFGFDLSHEKPKPAWLDYVFRFSWYHSRMSPSDGTILAPAFLSGTGFDLLAEQGLSELPDRKKPHQPTISFCGREGGDVQLRIWRMLPRNITRNMAQRPFFSKTRGVRGICCYPMRVDAMEQLAADQRIDDDFIRRGKVQLTPTVADDRRGQFIANLQSSDYALCVRGAENYSWRFFEALSLGVIPVLVDTDSVLPLEDEIPWEELIVRVPATEMQTLPARLLTYHQSMSEEVFAERRQTMRSLFEKLLPENFFSHTIRKQLARLNKYQSA